MVWWLDSAKGVWRFRVGTSGVAGCIVVAVACGDGVERGRSSYDHSSDVATRGLGNGVCAHNCWRRVHVWKHGASDAEGGQRSGKTVRSLCMVGRVRLGRLTCACPRGTLTIASSGLLSLFR